MGVYVFHPIESSVAAATLSSSVSQHLPFPAFPVRVTLPPLAPVQAAGPPAEYHSDSAESLEEIPVALARLGTATPSGPPLRSSTCKRTSVPNLQQSSPSRTRRKTTGPNVAEDALEMAPRERSVFVVSGSGEHDGTGDAREKRKHKSKKLTGTEEVRRGSRVTVPVA